MTPTTIEYTGTSRPPYEIDGRHYSTIAVALGIGHRQALAYLTDPECVSPDYWAGELWDIDRAQRALRLDNTTS